MMHDKANPMTRVAAGLLLLALLGLLAGCGFHLKGYHQPVSPALNGLYVVDGDQRETLAGAVEHSLRIADVKLAADAASARYTLKITQQRLQSRVMAVDANGKALDSELRLQASFRLDRTAGGEPLEQQVEIVRQLSYTGVDELAQRNERSQLASDMRNDLADQIIRRLEALLK
ncbi:MAG: LPS assembly lipoprotein LptE [Candidatus Thiodiazotropha sp.]